MYGLGKQRSKLGKWLDARGIRQSWLSKQAQLSEDTITDLCKYDSKLPTGRTMKKILQALRQVDPKVKQDDFWSI